MEEQLKEELRSGEKVLWSGKPEAFETMDQTNKQPIIRRAIIIIGMVTAFYVGYIAYALSKGTEFKPMLVVIALICAVAGALNYIFDCRKLRRMKYFITDQRIIFMVDLPKSLEYAKINSFELKEDSDGHTSILFGTHAIKAKAYKWRSLAVSDAYIDEETGYCTRFAMYAVTEAEKAKEILSRYVPV